MRDFLPVLAVAALVLVLGWLGYRAFFAEGAAPELVLTQVEGSVERVRSGSSEPAVVGTSLGADDQLKAGPGATAVLRVGEDGQITMSEESSVRVLGATADGVRLELEDGRIEATVRPGSGALGVVAGEREVVATDGTFGVARTDDAVYVSGRDGSVELVGFGDLERLEAGQSVVAADGEAAVLTDEQRALLLTVAWPDAQPFPVEQVWVEGATNPNASVELQTADGAVATVAGADGVFRAEVPLREGPNPVTLVVVDAMGRTEQTTVELIRQREPEPLIIGVELR